MAIIQVGSGSYLDYVPPGQVGPTAFGGIPVSPSLASNFTGTIPTNDWASSLSYHFYGAVSGALFADPIAMKASSYGLNLSYTKDPIYIYDDQGNQVKYEFRFHQDEAKQIYGDLSVGLAGMSATNGAILEKASDYFVKALWQDSDSANQLHATFGHGSPYTFYERDGNADVVIKVNEFSTNAIGQPNSTVEVFQIDHVNGVFNGGQINMDLLVNAVAGSGSHIANSTQARVSIDHNGDGTFDYVKTFNFYPLDADVVNTEHYLQSEGRGTGASTIGALQNLNDGSIKVEVWKSQGTGDVQLQTGANASSITLPFDNLPKLFLDNDGANNILAAVPTTTEFITLGAAPSVGPTIDWDGAGEVWYHDHNVVGITINGAHYGLFAPVGSEWNLENGEIRSNLNGKDYFTSALLPDKSVDTLNYFYQHAFAVVTDSKATFSYDENNAKVITNFNVTTELKEPGFSDETVTALYRHQWLNSDDALTNYDYASPRGEMKLLEGNSFTTETAYTGMLPELPNLLDATKTQQLYNLIDAEYQNFLKPDKDIPGLDTYFVGKALQRLSELTHIADQVGHDAAKEYFINVIKTELADWFTATGATDDKQFIYNAQWDTFQGYPASFESQKELNDHHFHHAYFIKAAATIAQFDPAWVSQWGGMVDLLIKDIANIDRDSTVFPYLRNFDPYAGHSWANGHGGFAAGNNQESTSEALNFASALVLWGAQTDNQGYQDIGAYLFATELAAVQQYWFDVDNAVFPEGYKYNEASIVWGDGANYATFFGGLPEFPEFVQGIQFLPMSGASLYLGLDPAYMQKNYQDLISLNKGEPNQWVNIFMEYQAMFDAQAAVNKLNAGFASLQENYFEQGGTVSQTYHWVQNFNVFGSVQAGITADSPFFAVFNKDGLITHTAYNPSNTEMTVHFSDGFIMMLASEELKAVNNNVTWSSVTGTVVNPDPTPVPVPTPIPDPIPTPVPQPEPTPVPTPDPIPTPTPTPVPEPTPTDTIVGTTGNDFLSGKSSDDVINGLAGDDQLHGIDGNDELHGGDGNDFIYGNVGNDKLIGGAGKDFLVGGDGSDVFKYLALSDSTKSAPDFIETFETGKDKIDLSALNVAFNQLVFTSEHGYNFIGISGTDFSIKVGGGAVLSESDFVLSGATPAPQPEPVPTPVPIPEPTPVPAPTPTITGTANNDFLSGKTSDDVITGLAGNDQLHGIDGNDQLHGGDGNDFVYGNAGDDKLIGGLGADFLVGGDGKDVYSYEKLSDSVTASRDTVEGFRHGTDKLDLTLLNVSANDVNVTTQNGIQTVSVANSDFAIDFIASDPISHDDIIV